MALTIRAQDLCVDADDNSVRILENLSAELLDDIRNNQIYGIDIDKLTARQRNAIFGWVHWTIEQRIMLIRKNIKERK